MIARTIHDFPDFRLVSWGNGTAYELIDKQGKRSAFFQGGDALELASEFEALTSRGLDFRDALCCLWNDYAECAQPWEPVE